MPKAMVETPLPLSPGRLTLRMSDPPACKRSALLWPCLGDPSFPFRARIVFGSCGLSCAFEFAKEEYLVQVEVLFSYCACDEYFQVRVHLLGKYLLHRISSFKFLAR